MSDPEKLRQRVRARLEEQRALVERLLTLREQLQGSLFARYSQCGKPSCACQKGERHGPYYVLSARGAAGSGFAYLAGERVPEARELVGRHRDFKKGLRRLAKLNADLVGLLKQYQTAMARRGGQRIGLAASA